MVVKAAIFDWDGVLVDSFPVAVRAFHKIFSEMNLDFTADDLKKTFGSGAKKVITSFLDSKGIEYTKEQVKDILKRKIEVQLALWEDTKILPGVEELLKELDGKLKTAIASGNNRVVIDNVLNHNGLDRFFSEIITIEDAGNPKPAPDIFLKAAEKLGIKPEECVVFEDSPAGIQAAKKARMKVIAVLTGPREKSAVERENPDLIADSMAETNRINSFLGV